jgi:hypothetical protein
MIITYSPSTPASHMPEFSIDGHVDESLVVELSIEEFPVVIHDVTPNGSDPLTLPLGNLRRGSAGEDSDCCSQPSRDPLSTTDLRSNSFGSTDVDSVDEEAAMSPSLRSALAKCVGR